MSNITYDDKVTGAVAPTGVFTAADANEVKAAVNSKQDALVSATNIKTINSESILGEGNIVTPDTTYSASDFDVKDLTDSTNLRTTWSAKQSTPSEGAFVNGDKTALDSLGAFKNLIAESGTVTSSTYDSVQDSSKSWEINQWTGYRATLLTTFGTYDVTIQMSGLQGFGFSPPIGLPTNAAVTIEDSVQTGVLEVSAIGALAGTAGNDVDIILVQGTGNTGTSFVAWDGTAKTLTVTVDSNALSEPQPIMTGNIESLINTDPTTSPIFLATFVAAGNLVAGTYTLSGGFDDGAADGTFYIHKTQRVLTEGAFVDGDKTKLDGTQPSLGAVETAGKYLIEETVLGVQGLYAPGTWKLFYTDGAGGGLKELNIGSFGSFLRSNGTGGPPSFEVPSTDKVKFTVEGGLAVKMTNKTGGASVKGYLVSASPAVDNAVVLTPIGAPDCIGVCYETDIADGEEMWVVVSGIADVYFWDSTTRGHLARVGFDSDTGEVAGQAISEAIPGTPFQTDKHWAEIGHVIQTRTGAGLAKCVLHFN